MELHSASFEVDGKLNLVDLAFGESTLELRAGSMVVETWNIDSCRIESQEGGQFLLTAGQDSLLLRPQEPRRFQTAVAKAWPRQTLAEKVVAVRGAHAAPTPLAPGPVSPPEGTSEPWWKLQRNKIIIAVSLLLALVVGVSIAEQPEGFTITTIVTSANPPVISSDSAFTLTQGELIDRWNNLSTKFNAGLRIADEADDLEFDYKVNSRIRLTGTVNPSTRLVSGLVLVAEPTGKGGKDLDLVASWGILLASADPQLNGYERNSLMSELGVDVNAPALIDDTTEVIEAGILYRLAANSELGLVLLQVEPV